MKKFNPHLRGGFPWVNVFSILPALLFPCLGKTQTPAAAPPPSAAAAVQPAAAQSGTNALEEDLNALAQGGLKAFQTGDYSAAIANLEQVIAKAGNDSQLEPIYLMLGSAYFNSEQYPKAIATFTTLQQKYPQSAQLAETTFSLGQACLLNKDFQGAIAQMAKLEEHPKYREQALYYEALACKSAGKPAEAIKSLEKLGAQATNSPISINGAMLLVSLYLENKESPKATKLFQQVYKKSELLDNVAQFNVTAAEIGDHLLGENHPAEALDAYNMIRSREEVLKVQAAKVTAAQKRLDLHMAVLRAKPAELAQNLQIQSRLKEELAKAKRISEEAEKMPDFGSGLLMRRGKAWFELGAKWEAIVALRQFLQNYPQAPESERDTALFSMILAYMDLRQIPRSQQLCERYLKEFPKGKEANTTGYLFGMMALQTEDFAKAESWFGRMLVEQPQSSFRSDILFCLGGARFSQGRFQEAIPEYERYCKEFPDGQRFEEAKYRVALALVFAGKYEAAMEKLDQYLKQYPEGDFAADAKYRLMICKYAAQVYEEVVEDARAWQQKYPADSLTGEVLSLKADSFAAQGKAAEAIAAYVESYKRASSEQVLNYALFEAAKQMQKLGKWAEISEFFVEFVKNNPESPLVVNSMYWIAKAKAREGKAEEAKALLVEQIQRFINDPKRESVERLLEQLAQLCSKRPRPLLSATTASAAPSVSGTQEGQMISPAAPAPLPVYDSAAELDRQLAPLQSQTAPIAKARLLYAKAELALLRKKPNEQQGFIGEIARQFKPADLSPMLLAMAGDNLLASGDSPQAALFYNELKAYQESEYLGFAYVGLGEIAFGKKDYSKALEDFTQAADTIAGAKVKEATVGKAKALLELARYEEARKIFEQIASIREWRGEATACAVYNLGEIERRLQHWPEAIARFQRVFVLYQKYLPWVARAYIASAECFEKEGKRPEAIKHLQELLRNQKLAGFPETQNAQKLLEQWGGK